MENNVRRPYPLDLAVLLTPKELQAATLLHKGLSLRQIAKEMGIRYNTVRNHLMHIQMKTGMSRIELVIAIERMSPIITEEEIETANTNS